MLAKTKLHNSALIAENQIAINYLMIRTLNLLIVAIFCGLQAFAQLDTSKNKRPVDRQQSVPIDSSKQRDLIDVINRVRHKDTSGAHNKFQRLNFSAVPSIGYTLSTGFALDITANVAFFTSSDHKENLSNIESDLAYDTKSQLLFFNRAEIWMPDNRYHFVTDIRLEKFPTTTYGIGTLTTDANANDIVYKYTRVYLTGYKTVAPDFYLGAGYNLDYFFGITEKGTMNGQLSDFKRYGEPAHSISSGFNVDALYDDRKNSINPLGGSFVNIIYRQNFKFMGSGTQWGSVLADLRKYFRPSASSNNVLAFWAMGWFSSAGTPYLNLPANGQDMYGNSGRGYVEGRFKGNDMLYLESEYRFGISRNGFLGGVLFVNGESLSEYQSSTFKRVAPGFGTGIRLKVNKHSNTNVCIDYGFGASGSKGLFVNLGEVF